LNLIAKDTSVSVSSAGQLVTAYALGIAIGAPLLTGRFRRRLLLRLSLVAFVAGNALAIGATSFHMLLLARMITGSIHGLFIGVASVIAAGLVATEHRGRAISMVFGGIAVSTVVGVPAGTLIGQTLSWRAALVAVFILAVVALVASLLFIPPVSGRSSGKLRSQARAAFAPRVLGMPGTGLLLMGAQFTAFTYLARFLSQVTGVSGGLVSVFLLVFGLAAAGGTFLGGGAADRSATTTLLVANVVLLGALGALYLVGATPVLVLFALAAWGSPGSPSYPPCSCESSAWPELAGTLLPRSEPQPSTPESPLAPSSVASFSPGTGPPPLSWSQSSCALSRFQRPGPPGSLRRQRQLPARKPPPLASTDLASRSPNWARKGRSHVPRQRSHRERGRRTGSCARQRRRAGARTYPWGRLAGMAVRRRGGEAISTSPAASRSGCAVREVCSC
jgi:DHA1 family inner membrane transport protein